MCRNGLLPRKRGPWWASSCKAVSWIYRTLYFPSKSDTSFFKKNLFTGFVKDTLYLLLGCRLHYRIKRKKKCRQLNKFCSGNSSVKQDESILLRQEKAWDRILLPISFFWRVVNVGHWLFWNFPSLFNILPCSLPSSLQWWLYWKGPMHVLVKRVIMRGRIE